MVLTRAQTGAQSPASAFALLDSLLAGNWSLAKQLLAQDSQRAHVVGPSGFGALHAAALTDCYRVVDRLLAAGLDVNQQIGLLDGPAAFTLREFLREHSKLPSSKLCAVFRGVTPVHIASWLGHQNTLQALLQAGADTELPCLEGRTALAIACYFIDCRPKRSLAIIESLLEAGADPLCADFHGIGSLVLSPSCPAHIHNMLLDRVLLRYGGPAAALAAAPAELKGSYEAGPSISSAAVGPAAGPEAESAMAAAADGGEAEAAQLPVMQLPPDRHVDVLQASLGSRHWRVFDFFLSATSAEVQYPAHAVNRILSLAVINGQVPLVLRILDSGLRPNPAGYNSQGHPHVAVAAVHGHEAVLNVLCSRGGSVTLKALHHAADSRSVRGLRLLLARGRPAVLTDDRPVHIGGAHSRTGETCVVLRLLRDTAFRLRYCYSTDKPRHAADSLAMVELLAEAGYRPTIYPQAIVHNGWIDMHGRLVQNYDPTVDKPAAFDLQGVNKYTWLAAKREPWTSARHHSWPPKFKHAVRQLLLIYHAGREANQDDSGSGGFKSGCGSSSGGPLTRAAKRARLKNGQAPKHHIALPAPAPAAAAKARSSGAAGRKRGLDASVGLPADGEPAVKHTAAVQLPALAALPCELLLRIIQEAAYPISAWV